MKNTMAMFDRLYGHIKTGYAGINPAFDSILANAKAEHAALVAVAVAADKINRTSTLSGPAGSPMQQNAEALGNALAQLAAARVQ